MGPILEEAAAQVGLSICTYDVHTHRITFARNRAAQNLRERWSIPAVLEHVPSLESTWIAEEDFPAYCDLYRAIDSGAPTASCTYRLKTEADAAPCYRTIAYTTVFDDRNEPVYAFGVGKDVTETRLEEQKYTRAVQDLFDSNPTCLGTTRLDLTDNVRCDFHARKPFKQIPQRSQTADDFFASVARSIADDDLGRQFTATFTRANLIEQQQRGKTILSIRYPTRFNQEGVEWVTEFFNLMRNPITGHIECIAYISDATIEHQDMAIAEALSKEEYSCVGVIRVKDRSCILHSFQPDSRQTLRRVPLDYARWCESETQRYVAPQDREAFLHNTSLSRVLTMLQDASRYSFTAHVTVQSTDELMRYTFRFLNTSHTSILFTIEDVSNVVDHDSLTDAYSRSGFLKRAQAVLESSENRSEFAVAFFNVRGFKAVNAVFGRTAGDEVLQQIADRLKSSTLHPLVIGRFESDHFVCLVRRDDLDGSEVRRLCRDIYTTGTKEYRYFLHCGICMIDSDEYDVELICDYAKLSKDSVEDDFVKPYAVFDPKMLDRFIATRELTSDLQDSLDRSRFKVYYQPVYASATGHIVSAEALVRWEHPEHGIVSPGQFIPVFEENGFISQLDLFMEQSATRMLLKRVAERRHTVPIAVNLSRKDFYDTKMIADILNDLDSHKNLRGLMRFEVTESSLASISPESLAAIEAMRRLGAQILIDDFGSGYSSFEMLIEYDFDIIKLDMSFVRQIGTGGKAEPVIASLIEGAHSIGMRVIAEGVETAGQVSFLTEHGCDYLQGFYFSKPMPEDEFAHLLDEERS